MEDYMNEPQPDAVDLFDGANLYEWVHRNGQTATWQVENGILQVVPGSGDIMTRALLTDFFLHLEFRCPRMPEARGQDKANSGVYLQGRYEIQILDSYQVVSPGTGDCGAIYDQFAPLVNACRPAHEWQTYDIVFRSARRDNEALIEPARVTVLQNGRVIHNNVQLQGPTPGSLDDQEGTPGPILLQDHGDRVAFRNIWAVELEGKPANRRMSESANQRMNESAMGR